MVLSLWKIICQHLIKLVIHLSSKPWRPVPWNLPKRNKSICSHKDLYANAQSSIIHNRQTLGTTQMYVKL